VLSVGYGAGIALSRMIQNQSAAGSKAGLDSFILGQTAGMIRQDVYFIGGVALVCLVLTVLLFKEFKLVAFDPAFADVQGWPIIFLDLVMMSMVAVSVVIGLPAVGAILTAALLIIPAAAARFWTERLEVMLVISATIGLLTGAIGTMISASVPGIAAGPVIVLVATAFFVISLIAAPQRGIFTRLVQSIKLRNVIAEQSNLRQLYHLVESKCLTSARFRPDTISDAAASESVPVMSTLVRLERSGVLSWDEGVFEITEDGWKNAVQAARNHRIREYVVDHHPESAGHLADPDAESIESMLAPDLRNDIIDRLKQQNRLPSKELLLFERRPGNE